MPSTTVEESFWPRTLLPAALAEIREPTPFLATDCGQILERIDALRHCVPSAYPHYAVKCNPSVRVLETMQLGGAGFEIASVYELDVLRGLGVNPRDVLYSNTVKPADHIAAAAVAGVWRYAFDSESELRKLAAVAPGSAVYVRLAVPDSHSLFPLSRKFGTSRDEAVRLLVLATVLGLRPYGVTFHVGSQCTEPRQFDVAIEHCGRLLRQLDRAGIALEMLDLGGGFPAPYLEAVPSIHKVGAVIEEAISRLPYRPRTIVCEPGRFLVANSSVLASTVIGVALRGDERWVYLDVGGYNGMMEAVQTGGRWRFPMLTSRDADEIRALFTVTGPTCDSSDTMFYGVDLPLGLTSGDRVYIGSAGAYTLSYASSFNGFPAPRPVFVDL